MVMLSKQAKEKLVINLRSEGKSYREIAEIARMSPRDIGTIMNNAEASLSEDNNRRMAEQEQELKVSKQTATYDLFSKGKNPIQVAVALNLP